MLIMKEKRFSNIKTALEIILTYSFPKRRESNHRSSIITRGKLEKMTISFDHRIASEHSNWLNHKG